METYCRLCFVDMSNSFQEVVSNLTMGVNGGRATPVCLRSADRLSLGRGSAERVFRPTPSSLLRLVSGVRTPILVLFLFCWESGGLPGEKKKGKEEEKKKEGEGACRCRCFGWESPSSQYLGEGCHIDRNEDVYINRPLAPKREWSSFSP